MDNFWNGFEKRAEGKDEPTWWQGQKGAYRASRAGDKGLGLLFANKDLIKARASKGADHAVKGLGIGGLLGSGIGAIAGARRGNVQKGALIGGALGGGLGGLGGFDVGIYRGEKKYLADRGIDRRWGGLSHKFSPEAKKKYIDDYEKK